MNYELRIELLERLFLHQAVKETVIVLCAGIVEWLMTKIVLCMDVSSL